MVPPCGQFRSFYTTQSVLAGSVILIHLCSKNSCSLIYRKIDETTFQKDLLSWSLQRFECSLLYRYRWALAISGIVPKCPCEGIFSVFLILPQHTRCLYIKLLASLVQLLAAGRGALCVYVTAQAAFHVEVILGQYRIQAHSQAFWDDARKGPVVHWYRYTN